MSLSYEFMVLIAAILGKNGYTVTAKGLYAQLHTGAPTLLWQDSTLTTAQAYGPTTSKAHQTLSRVYMPFDFHVPYDPAIVDGRLIRLYTTQALTFPAWPSQADNETITHITLWDTPTVGGTDGWFTAGTQTPLWNSALATPVTMRTGDIFNLPTFNISVREDLS